MNTSDRFGYTLVELLMVIGIMAILASIGGMSFASMRVKNQLDLSASEIRTELMRARSREANGIDTGVFFDTDRFVYFEDSAYTEGALGNIETEIPRSLAITENTFSGGIAVFDSLTGELESYLDPSHIVLTDTQSGMSRTISVNRWGLVEVE